MGTCPGNLVGILSTSHTATLCCLHPWGGVGGGGSTLHLGVRRSSFLTPPGYNGGSFVSVTSECSFGNSRRSLSDCRVMPSESSHMPESGSLPRRWHGRALVLCFLVSLFR